MIGILSIDVGLRNLSLCKEYYDMTEAKKIPKVSKNERYNKDQTSTDKYKEYINNVSKCGALKMIDKTDLTKGGNAKFITTKVLLNLIDYLDSLNKKGYFEDIDCVLLEKQLKTNPNAQVIEAHIHNYFLMLYRDTIPVVLYPSKNKTRVLGMELRKLDEKTNKIRKVVKRERKIWACDQALQLLTRRRDIQAIEYIFKKNKSKKDDLSDILIQCLSYVLLQLD
jgi:hypothetical protein